MQERERKEAIEKVNRDAQELVKSKQLVLNNVQNVLDTPAVTDSRLIETIDNAAIVIDSAADTTLVENAKSIVDDMSIVAVETESKPNSAGKSTDLNASVPMIPSESSDEESGDNSNETASKIEPLDGVTGELEIIKISGPGATTIARKFKGGSLNDSTSNVVGAISCTPKRERGKSRSSKKGKKEPSISSLENEIKKVTSNLLIDNVQSFSILS